MSGIKKGKVVLTRSALRGLREPFVSIVEGRCAEAEERLRDAERKLALCRAGGPRDSGKVPGAVRALAEARSNFDRAEKEYDFIRVD